MIGNSYGHHGWHGVDGPHKPSAPQTLTPPDTPPQSSTAPSDRKASLNMLRHQGGAARIRSDLSDKWDSSNSSKNLSADEQAFVDRQMKMLISIGRSSAKAEEEAMEMVQVKRNQRKAYEASLQASLDPAALAEQEALSALEEEAKRTKEASKEEALNAFASLWPAPSHFEQQVLKELLNPLSKNNYEFTPEGVRENAAEFAQVRQAMEKILSFARIGHTASNPKTQELYNELQKRIGGPSGKSILEKLDAVEHAAKKGWTSKDITTRSGINFIFTGNQKNAGILKQILDDKNIREMMAEPNTDMHHVQDTFSWLAKHVRTTMSNPEIGSESYQSHQKILNNINAAWPSLFAFNLFQHIQHSLANPAQGLLQMPSDSEYRNVSAGLDRLIKVYSDAGLHADPVCQHAIQSKHDWEWKKLTQQWSPETTRLHNMVSNEVNFAPQQQRPTRLLGMPTDAGYTQAYEGLNHLIKTYENMLASYGQTGFKNPHMQQIYQNALQSRNYWVNEKLNQVSTGPLHQMIESLRAKAPPGQTLKFVSVPATPQNLHDLDWLIHAYTAAGKSQHPVCKIAEETRRNLQRVAVNSSPAPQNVQPAVANSFPAQQTQSGRRTGFRQALRNLFR